MSITVNASPTVLAIIAVAIAILYVTRGRR